MAVAPTSNAPAPDPRLWTFDWKRGLLGAKPEDIYTCAHFSDVTRPLFDLASVTKISVSGTLLAQEFLESKRSLAEFFEIPILPEVPELEGSALANLRIGELWEHRSGLLAHRLLFSSDRGVISSDRAAVWKKFLEDLRGECLVDPKVTIYSDVGMLLLGLWLERKRGRDLSQLFEDWKQRHGMGHCVNLRYGVADSERHRVPPTESRHPVAQVNDDNCFCMGGVGSHAGLFGGVHELWSWLEALNRWSQSEERLAKEWLNVRPGIERFHAGWDTPSLDLSQPSQAGLGAPPGTLGHLGFTGTAVWWNPRTRQAVILLSNRVRPQDSMESRALIRKCRQEFFKDLWHNKDLGGESWKAAVKPAS